MHTSLAAVVLIIANHIVRLMIHLKTNHHELRRSLLTVRIRIINWSKANTGFDKKAPNQIFILQTNPDKCVESLKIISNKITYSISPNQTVYLTLYVHCRYTKKQHMNEFG